MYEGSYDFGRTLSATAGKRESALGRKRIATTAEGALAIAQRVRALRKARGITQVELAQRLSISQALVSKYENGEVLLHGELIAFLAGLLRTSADELLGLRHKKTATLPATVPDVDRGLARRFALVQSLPKRDRDALTRTIDAFLTARGGRAAA